MMHVPILRFGSTHRSADTRTITDFRKQPIAHASMALPLLVHGDVRKTRRNVSERLRRTGIRQIHRWVRDAGRIFASETLRSDGVSESPAEYCRNVMLSTGLPLRACHEALTEIAQHMDGIEEIVASQCFGADTDILDTFTGTFRSRVHGWTPAHDVLCAVMPGNHPLVNMMWVIAFAMKYPLVLKPSLDDPFTPLRIVRSLIEAGASPEFFGFYPAERSSVSDILRAVGLGIVFGGPDIERLYASHPWIRVYGPGNSKIVVGSDWDADLAQIARFVANSALYHSGRACISASSVVAESRGRELACAIGEIFSEVTTSPPESPDAVLGAMKERAAADAIAAAIERAVRSGGVTDMNPATAVVRRVRDATYLMPKVLYCENHESEIFGREYPFPFVTVTEARGPEVLRAVKAALSCSVLSRNETLARELLMSPSVEKTFVGPIAPCRMDYCAPHKGFLSEFLYKFKGFLSASHMEHAS